LKFFFSEKNCFKFRICFFSNFCFFLLLKIFFRIFKNLFNFEKNLIYIFQFFFQFFKFQNKNLIVFSDSFLESKHDSEEHNYQVHILCNCCILAFTFHPFLDFFVEILAFRRTQLSRKNQKKQ